MYNKLKICKLIDSIGSQEKAAKELGISVGTGKDTKISTLETICNYFNMPIGALFTEVRDIYHSVTNGNGSAASVYGNAIVGELSNKDKEIEHLKQLLREKQNIIEEKERTIQILMKNKI